MTLTRDSAFLHSPAKDGRWEPQAPGALFVATVDSLTWQRLGDLLNCINYPALREYYEVNENHAEETDLLITDNKGQAKRINDYGMRGTPGLAAVQVLLMELKEQLPWKLVRSPAPYNAFSCFAR